MINVFKKNHAELGIEFDWLASDRFGRHGYFSTAGFGPIPQVLSEEEALVDDLFEKVIKLAKTNEPRIHVDVERNIGDWIAIAKRGFYAFDWRSRRSTYELIASPEAGACQPLPDEISRMLRMVALQVDFRETQVFSP